MSLSQTVGKRLREDGIHLDYRPDDKVGGPGPRRGINPRGITVKEYRGDFDVAYVDRCGPDVDWSRIENWVMGCGWTIENGEDGERLICRVTVGFRARARAVDLIGRQQIASLPTALSELFKNAHDAYATQARADFYRVHNLLAVTDDGVGMDRETFEDSWLTIATDSKLGRTRIEPPAGMAERTQLGQKGIGRFAMGALGSQVLVVSRRKGHATIAALVNWEMFELPNVDLNEVPVGLLELGDDKLTPADLEELRDPLHRAVQQFRELDRSQKWQEKLDRIESHLDGILDDPYSTLRDIEPLQAPGSHFLITPVSDDFIPDRESSEEDSRSSPLSQTLHGFTDRWLGGESTPDFTVDFFDHRPGGDTERLLDSDDFFNRADFDAVDHHIVGDFDASGHFSGLIRIFNAEPVEVEISRPRPSSPLCGPFRFELGVLQGNQSESRLEPDAFGMMRKQLDYLGGIYVYKDSIRVQPYGRPNVDYLEIEERRSRGAGYYYFSYRRMFGAVSLTSEHNARLEEKAGREGFIQGRVYSDFRRLLINLFVELAARFFRESGAQGDTYEKGRARLKHEERARRVRTKRATKGRNQTGAALAAAVHYLDSADVQAAAENIVQSTKVLLNTAESLGPAMEHVSDARRQLTELLDPLRIDEPEGYALTEPMRLDLAHVETSRDKLEESVVTPAMADINKLGAEVGQRLATTKEDEAERQSFIEWKLTSARSAVEAEEIAGRQVFSSLQSVVEEAFAAESKSFREALETLPRPRSSSNAEWLQDQAVFESTVDELVHRYQRAFRRISGQTETSRLMFGPETVTPTELAAAADAEILELRARADDQLELVQLGMALAVVDHEFRTTVSSFRSDVRRVGEWAKLNPPMRSLYEDLRRDFDHLDSYLTLLTPLQRRLRRAKTTIKGVNIARFLKELFRDRLEGVKAEITVTPSFRAVEIEGFTSTFYPVFINLADNSLYWFGRAEAESDRRIELDARDEMLIYSDNGPGVDADIADRVFDFGFTTRPGGSGLGLAIARQVLEHAGWSIELGKRDKGVEFLIAPLGGNL